MLFRTHVVSFLLLFLLIFEEIENPLIFLFFGLFFTIFPDIDSPNSKVGKFFISKVLTSFSKHRGIFHSLIFVLTIYVFLKVNFEIISFAFLVGYCVHLFLDCFTRQGVKIFYPFSFKISGPLRSGGRIESFLFILISLLVLFLLGFEIYSRVL